MAGLLDAEAIGRAALVDPQLRVPRRPRLRRGLVVDVGDDQVVVTGTPTRQVFRGASATRLLPRLLEHLDGVRDHAALAAALEIPEPTVFKALSLLWACGVVEESSPPGLDVPDVPDRLADFLSRIGDSTGANDAWEQSVARLAAERVVVSGSGPLSRAVLEELDAPLLAEPLTGVLPPAGTTLVILVDELVDEPVDERVVAGREQVGGTELAQWCWDHRVALLRVRLRGDGLDLGPLAAPGLTPCLACQRAGDLAGEDDDRTASARTDAPELALAGAMAAAEVFALLSRATPVVLPTRWRRVDLRALTTTERAAATRPGCPACSVRPGPTEPAPLSAHYEAAVAIPPRRYADLKAHQAHYKPSNLALQRSFRRWPLSPRVVLPALDLGRLSADLSPTRPPDVADLGLVLATTAGIRDVAELKVNRWTAAGGNIGSVTAHVVIRDWPGVDPGVYAYVAADHQLALLPSDPGEVGGREPATLVLTGDYRKVARKYGAFALRIVLLDSGCAQTTARWTCDVLGLPLRLRTEWDDAAVASALQLDPTVEPVTAVLDLGDVR